MFKWKLAGYALLTLPMLAPSITWAWSATTWKSSWVCTVTFPTGGTVATTTTYHDARLCIDYYKDIRARNIANYPGAQLGLKIDNKQVLPALAVAPRAKRCVVVAHDASIFTTTYPIESEEACLRFYTAMNYAYRYESDAWGTPFAESNTLFLRNNYIRFSDFTVGAFWGDEVASYE